MKRRSRQGGAITAVSIADNATERSAEGALLEFSNSLPILEREAYDQPLEGEECFGSVFLRRILLDLREGHARGIVQQRGLLVVSLLVQDRGIGAQESGR